MSRYILKTTKPDYSFSVTVSSPDAQDARTEEMMRAMREGLEANGFDVDIEVFYSKALKI